MWQATHPLQVKTAGNKGPSWSWASLNSEVFWPTTVAPYSTNSPHRRRRITPLPKTRKSKCEISSPLSGTTGDAEVEWAHLSGPLHQDIIVDAHKLPSIAAAFPRGIDPRQTTTFVPTLQVRGQLRKVLKSSTLLNEAERRDFETACDLPLLSTWLEECHGIYHDDPEDLIGWGSFEEIGLSMQEALKRDGQSTERAEISAASDAENVAPLMNPSTGSGVCANSPSDFREQTLYCLLLSSYQVRGGPTYGYIRTTHSVYEVLYLRLGGSREGETAYRRVGVGQIIKKGFFKNVKAETITLV